MTVKILIFLSLLSSLSFASTNLEICNRVTSLADRRVVHLEGRDAGLRFNVILSALKREYEVIDARRGGWPHVIYSGTIDYTAQGYAITIKPLSNAKFTYVDSTIETNIFNDGGNYALVIARGEAVFTMARNFPDSSVLDHIKIETDSYTGTKSLVITREHILPAKPKNVYRMTLRHR